jgi:hypothetical protein
VAIYRHAKGVAHYYQNPSVDIYWYCAYDGQRNLFISGITHGDHHYILIEMPQGRHVLERVKLSPDITGDVSLPLFWDGKYLAIASPTSPAQIYRYLVAGKRAKRIAAVKLDDADYLYNPFWIAGTGKAERLYAPVTYGSVVRIAVYAYPKGGRPTQTFYDVVSPFGAAISSVR